MYWMIAFCFVLLKIAHSSLLYRETWKELMVMSMNKKMNLIGLSLTVGIMIGFAPNMVRVLTLAGVISILWNQWDEYCVNGRGKV